MRAIRNMAQIKKFQGLVLVLYALAGQRTMAVISRLDGRSQSGHEKLPTGKIGQLDKAD